MDDSEVMHRCTDTCLPNCQEVTYSYVMDTTILEANELCQDGSDTREVFLLIIPPKLYFEQTFLKLALSQWNSTGNVQTWFHRLALSKGEFKIQTGNNKYEVNYVKSTLIFWMIISICTFIFA